MPAMSSPRRSNSAKPEELITTLRLHLPGGLDKKYLDADPGNVVKSYENLLIDLLYKTCRPTKTLLQQACLKAFQNVKKDEAGIWARAVSDACSYCFQKNLQTTTGAKLDPAVRRVVAVIQKLDKQQSQQAKKKLSLLQSLSLL